MSTHNCFCLVQPPPANTNWTLYRPRPKSNEWPSSSQQQMCLCKWSGPYKQDPPARFVSTLIIRRLLPPWKDQKTKNKKQKKKSSRLKESLLIQYVNTTLACNTTSLILDWQCWTKFTHGAFVRLTTSHGPNVKPRKRTHLFRPKKYPSEYIYSTHIHLVWWYYLPGGGGG